MLSLFYFTAITLLFIRDVHAEVTVYTTILQGTSTGSAISAFQTALCVSSTACDGNVITPIQNPTPDQGLSQSVPVQLLTGQVPGLSLPVSGDFQGFSIELSVANQILGNDGNKINPIFLNLMATVVDRASRALVRVGGNSQESATVVPQGLPNGTAIVKTSKEFTPTLLLSPGLVYAMGNVSSFVNVDWFIGVPFNDTNNPRTLLAEISQAVLGSHLLGMQLGNEPDLYSGNGIRLPGYTQQTYFTEWGQVLADYQNDNNVPMKNLFVAPSVCCGISGNGWTPEQVWDTGFLDSYGSSLSYVSVEHYPTNNCNDSGILDPNDLLPQFFLNHSAVIELSQPYINSTQLAQGISKPFIMFETNSASCGGFSGLSDSFATALWAVDYNLNMASVNFSNALYHVGGQSDYYNPFTPPPTNQTKFRQWTIGATFYSALVTAEALGTSKKAQVMDLFLNNNNNFSPGYAIYEDGVPQRLVLINYLTDPSGASNYTAYISIGGNSTNTPSQTPATVTVKYLLAPSVSEKWNITWAGQTFGGAFESDGRLQGTAQSFTVSCDTANNVCPVTVPAPAVAIVFLSDASLQESQASATQTFATTFATETINTAAVDPSVLATSNGRGGQNFIGLGSTSPGSSSNTAAALKGSALLACIAVISGLLVSLSPLIQ